MRAFEEAMPRFARLNTQVLGISVDSVPTKEAWAKSLGIRSFPLLSDFWPHGEVVRSYRVLNDEKGFAKRAVVVVDKEGLIRFSKVYAMREVPDVGEILEVVRRLEAKRTKPKGLERRQAMAKWECLSCGYIYDPAVGDPDGGIPPGTSFEDLPDDWVCPECGVGKEMFEKLEE